MPILQRYSNIKQGGIVFTGNTLGLSKLANANSPGVEGSIGAFISLDTSLQVSTFPPGTTLDYLKNGSLAKLNLPVGSTVLYAELVWGGLYKSSENNISAIINNSITFNTPIGANTVAPDILTKQDFLIPAGNITVGFYVRSANVTEIVKAAQNGNYSVAKVPALIERIDAYTADTNHAGWTLAVAYENSSLPLRNLTLWAGGTVVSPNTGSTDIAISGFLTPDVLPITGKIFVSSQEGDAVLSGDQMLFGKNIASLSNISGVNNPTTNFFASQINDSNGVLDTSGTFGTRNANAFTQTNTSGCRQGWDITAVDVSNKLVTGQNSAAIRFTTVGDLYVPNCLGLQVDSKGANLVVTKKVNKTYAEVGEVIGYEIDIANIGNIDALNVVITDLLPSGTTLVPNSITVNGVPYLGALPVTIPTILAGATAKVIFDVTIDEFPSQNPIFNVASVTYDFYPFTGYKVSSSANSNYAYCYIIKKALSIIKSVNKNFAVKGENIKYTSVIKNTGSIPIIDVFFTDAIPVGTTFLQDSVFIDNINFPTYDPSIGFLVKNLMPNESVTVDFEVIIN